VLADYMLMADFVRMSGGGMEKISKGVRRLSPSRDIFVTSDGSPSFAGIPDIYSGHFPDYVVVLHSSTNRTGEIAYFGKEFLTHTYGAEYTGLKIDGTIVASSETVSGATVQKSIYPNSQPSTLGITKAGMYSESSKAHLSFQGFDLAIPTHTSSHYQTFETPYLHELVGGDRNMEQNNLVVTADGKTWDEVTRDTSYIGNVLVTTNWASQNNTNTTVGVGDEFRGYLDAKNLFVKDFAIARDRLICLVDGHYQIIFGNHMNSDSGAHYSRIRINGVIVRQVYFEASGNGFVTGQLSIPLKRGDYVDHQGMHFTNETWQFQINRLK
jgi:hypothetical protein